MLLRRLVHLIMVIKINTTLKTIRSPWWCLFVCFWFVYWPLAVNFGVRWCEAPHEVCKIKSTIKQWIWSHRHEKSEEKWSWKKHKLLFLNRYFNQRLGKEWRNNTIKLKHVVIFAYTMKLIPRTYVANNNFFRGNMEKIVPYQFASQQSIVYYWHTGLVVF